MEYNREVAFNILKAMESYPDSTVPSPHEPLLEDTGRPAPSPPRDIIAPDISLRLRADLPNLATRVVSTQETTDPKSWVGEMNTNTFLAHVNWLKQERFVSTKGGNPDFPREITITGVRLLKEVEAKGGWEKAIAIAREAKAPETLTGLLEALRKARPQN